MSTRRSPNLPSNGAEIFFFSRLALMLSTCACAALAWDCAASNSERDTTLLRNKRATRSRLLCARAKSESAALSCASSVLVSCSSNRSPALTSSPPSKYSFDTLPGISAVMTTPWEASSVPTAPMVVSQSAFCTSMAVMAVGGGTMEAPAAMRSLICSPLMPPRITTIIKRPKMENAIRLIMIRMVSPVKI